MRKTWLAAATGAAALSLLVEPAALAGNATDKATGGGQVLLSSSGVKTSTIGFTAQETAGVSKGQVQVVDRDAGTGQNQTRFHGTVNCVVVKTNMAYIIGVGQDGTTPFEMYAADNGEGANATGADMILFRQGSQTTADDPAVGPNNGPCGVNKTDQAADLAHGNVQVTDGDTSN